MSLPAHLSAVARRAHSLHTQGSIAEARATLAQAIDMTSMNLGPDHPEVLVATRLLAAMHSDTGEFTEARRLLEEAIAGAHFTLGDRHPVLLSLTYDLALVANELGNRHEARRNFGLLAEFGPGALGADHEYVRNSRRYLGVLTEPVEDPGATARIPTQPDHRVSSHPDHGRTADRERAAGYEQPPGHHGSGYDEQQRYDQQPGYDDQQRYDDQAGYDDQQRYGDQARYDDQQRYDDQSSYDDRTGYDDPAGYDDRAGREGQRGYEQPPPEVFVPSSRGRAPVPPPPPVRTDLVPVPRSGRGNRQQSRVPIIVLTVVALIALIAGTVATVVLLNKPDRQSGQSNGDGPKAGPTVTAAPEVAPSVTPKVQLRDDGGSITLTWTDQGKATLYLITGGRDGAGYRTLSQQSPDQKTYTVNGVDPQANYCFIVAGLYDANQVIPAAPVCTRRAGAKPS